jgi:hypothetical protein
MSVPIIQQDSIPLQAGKAKHGVSRVQQAQSTSTRPRAQSAERADLLSQHPVCRQNPITAAKLQLTAIH